MQEKLERALARRLAQGQGSDAKPDPEIDRLRRLVEIFQEDEEQGSDASGATSDPTSAEHEDNWSIYDDEFGETDEEGRWWPRRHWSDYGPRHVIPVEGGMAARSQHGEIGTTWWSKRFLASLEALAVGGRLSRGRNYARRGQVVDLTMGPGRIDSHVQGTRPKAYEVSVAIPPLDDAMWSNVIDLLAREAGYAAVLLAGEMPIEIEKVFAEAGANLFPERRRELVISCDCPDDQEPCKHAAAVCYLVAEAFDDDPFLLLALRGRERAHILAELRARRVPEDGGPRVVPVRTPSWPSLDVAIDQFWVAGPALKEVHISPRIADDPAAVLSQMRGGAVEVRGNELGVVLRAQYESMARSAIDKAY